MKTFKIIVLIALIAIIAMAVPVSGVLMKNSDPVGSEVIVSGNVTGIDFKYPYHAYGAFVVIFDTGDWVILGDAPARAYGVHAYANEELVWQIKLNHRQQLTFSKNFGGWELVQVQEFEKT